MNKTPVTIMLSRTIKLITYLSFVAVLLHSCTQDVESPSIINSEPIDDEIAYVDHINTDVILDWSALFVELDRYAEGMRPNASARALAYVYLAAYEVAAPVMESYQSNDGKIDNFLIFGKPNTQKLNIDIALNSAYATVINHFLINLPDDRRAEIAELKADISASLNATVDSEVVEVSEKWGELVASQIIQFAKTDRRAERQILDPQPTSYTPPTGDGYWTFSAEPERALYPFWNEVRTFIISSDETSTVPPLQYSLNPLSPYFQEMEEVYHANNEAKVNQGEQMWIAEFWSDDVTGLMFGPPVRQLSIANQLIEQYDMDGKEALYMLMKLGFSLNDAAVSTWNDKYHYMVMRPSIFVEQHMDPNFQTNLFRLIPWPNPSFPGYPSGHSAFASAAAGVFIDFFGNETNFTDRSHEGRTEFRGEPRTFSSFHQMAEENAFSRIPLGVHVRMDCDEGIRLGYEISDAVNNYDLTTP